VTLEMTKQAADLFLRLAGSFKDCLDRKQFGQLVALAAGVSSAEDLPKDTLFIAFYLCDHNKDGKISFSEFVTWYATESFKLAIACDERIPNIIFQGM